MSKAAQPRRRPTDGPTPRRRLPPAERSQRILDEAAVFFAERGLATSTRELAERLGVAQALIYRYFPSKSALIDQVFEVTFARLWDDNWARLLADRARPIEDRLTTLYTAYLHRAGAMSVRLFVRAGLEGADMARRYSVPLTDKLLRPVIAALRAEAGLPGFEVRPMMRGEREVAMSLHGAVVFLAIRKHVYGMPLPDDMGELVHLQVANFLPGVQRELVRLHGSEAEETLTIEHLDPQRRRA
ncbi:MAG: TetR/AcrR family transcriptional regulator [Alphaproteobacteria bacterium]|nr:TetR/AcrR family transcriptional regulator [Alphaproteobacteria bacterium]